MVRTGFTFADAEPGGVNAAASLGGGGALHIPLEGLVDVAKECAKLKTELAGLEKQLTALEGRLSNPGFVDRAPANVVEGERAKRDEWAGRREQLRTRIAGLCGAG
jgi:valyl-tRNA synthetase